MYIILAILGFSVLIIGHELGHFTLAKLNGVKVEEFSLGMGPKLFGIKGKETEYVIKALPIGGYVRMLGEEEAIDDKRSFSNKSPERKLSIIAAGPLMNLVMAVIFFMILGFSTGYIEPKISEVQSNSPAAAAGVKAGDKILRVNNKKISTWDDFASEIYLSKGENINLKVDRNGVTKSFDIVPVLDNETKRYLIGVFGTKVEHPGMIGAVKYGFIQTKSLIKQTYSSLATLFRGKLSLNDVGGPVTIIKASGEVAKYGFWSLLNFYAFLSINLAIFNIIPFPALDGGWILLLLFEIITRRKVDDKKVAVVNYVGFIMLMTLMVLVTIKDVLFPINF